MPEFVDVFERLIEEELRDELSEREWELFTDEEFMPPRNATGTYREYIFTVLNYYAAKVSLRQNRLITILTVIFGLVALLELVTAVITLIS